MQETNNNEEKKIEENNSNKMFDTDPLKSERNVKILDEIFNGSKGIEDLWKNIEKNENSTKKKLYDAEKKLLDTVGKLSQALIDIKNNNKKDNTIKDDYNTIIKSIYAQNEGMGTKFIKKFPNWSIQLADIIGRSHHYKRIANATDFKDANFKNDFKEDLNIKFNRKEKIKPTGLKGKAGSIFSSIGKFFKNFGKNFTGKASKSGVEKKVQAFFKRVNAPWRRWWEFICDGSQELSQKSAKQNLKTILDSNGDQNAKKEILKFFISPNNKTTKLSWEINDEVNNIGFVDDNDKSKINLMFRVFKSLDKKLGTRVEAKFNGEKGAKNIDTNDDKIKRLIELHKIFYTNKKAIRFSDVFELLVIDTKAKLGEKGVAEKVDELFNGSTFSDNENAKKDVKKLAEDAGRFLLAYSESDRSKRLLYELKFLGSCFKINDLNKVESVDQAISVLNRLPKNHVQEAIGANDPVIAKKIDEEIAKSAENIKSLNGALKNLDEEDFNKPENQQTLLNALGAIEKNNLLQLGTSERFEDLTLDNFCNKLAFTNDRKYAKIAGSINNVFKDSKDKKINEFIKELKESLVKQEVKKNAENIQAVKKALNKITTDVNKQNRLKTEKEVEDAIAAIKTCKGLKDEKGKECTYAAKDGRKKFLSDVAQRLGVQIGEKGIQVLCISEKDLAPPYNEMQGALLVQKLRNLIGYGLGYGTSTIKGIFKADGANSLPDLNDKDLVKRICNRLEIKN